MDLEDLSLMLRAFGMIPVPLSNDQVRTVFRQQKIASPQTAQDTLSRKEFPECLLRLAITAALARPDLSGASPQKKLYEFLKVHLWSFLNPRLPPHERRCISRGTVRMRAGAQGRRHNSYAEDLYGF